MGELWRRGRALVLVTGAQGHGLGHQSFGLSKRVCVWLAWFCSLVGWSSGGSLSERAISNEQQRAAAFEMEMTSFFTPFLAIKWPQEMLSHFCGNIGQALGPNEESSGERGEKVGPGEEELCIQWRALSIIAH